VLETGWRRLEGDRRLPQLVDRTPIRLNERSRSEGYADAGGSRLGGALGIHGIEL